MKLDLSSLKQAVNLLHAIIERARKNPEDDAFRDATIQRFEYTYELCWRMLKRQLEQEVANPSVIDQFSFKELIREGGERGLITHVEKWFEYRHQRNITSHTYNESKAISVFNTALDFYQDAYLLLKQLEKKNS